MGPVHACPQEPIPLLGSSDFLSIPRLKISVSGQKQDEAGCGLLCRERSVSTPGCAGQTGLADSCPICCWGPPGCVFSNAECILCGRLLAFWLLFAFLSPLTGGQETERVVALDSPWVIAWGLQCPLLCRGA